MKRSCLIGPYQVKWSWFRGRSRKRLSEFADRDSRSDSRRVKPRLARADAFPHAESKPESGPTSSHADALITGDGQCGVSTCQPPMQSLTASDMDVVVAETFSAFARLLEAPTYQQAAPAVQLSAVSTIDNLTQAGEANIRQLQAMVAQFKSLRLQATRSFPD